ncbi:hypothetical protein PPERSA_00172 [Pseudocohnilembus persalinus]|uniref:Cytosol aminopeptidase domain-containing protein n=1 Tax=Pseudocohnilembus persalinus TaxID=266149 RepID=A0A0V0QCU4_PSEPJ|nr:hypothetical protein PPERSA_00172 [Pseudocohnilembus persalinus]|eukprot:KRX00022.1 hypothetical protein PPERSA_00172 [Pseudocohnilembus persalinus]
MEFIKHKIFQNKQSFIPKIQVAKELQEQYQNLCVLLSEDDLAQTNNLPLKSLSEYLSENSALVDNLKAKNHIIVHLQNKKYLIFYTKDLNPKQGYNLARKNQKVIQQELKHLHEEGVNFYFSDKIEQNYLNEYIYGLFIENYQWQQKSYPENKESHESKSINHPIQKYFIISQNFDEKNSEFEKFLVIAKAKLYSKQLSNTRADEATTDFMLEEAKKFQQQNQDKVSLEYLDAAQIKQKGMNLMYAVGQASKYQSYLVCMEYKGNKDSKEKLALVGKGVVFDCGGLNLKRVGMDRMFGDKGGACTCLGIFKAIVDLNLKVNVVCTLPLVENSISGNSYRCGDIYKTLKGITVEIKNTDAEGRNILVEAITYTQQNYNVTSIMDIATLTGAAKQACGGTMQCIFSNDEEKSEKLQRFSTAHHEDLWQIAVWRVWNCSCFY